MYEGWNLVSSTNFSSKETRIRSCPRRWPARLKHSAMVVPVARGSGFCATGSWPKGHCPVEGEGAIHSGQASRTKRCTGAETLLHSAAEQLAGRGSWRLLRERSAGSRRSSRAPALAPARGRLGLKLAGE
jgi:hypothetical protein